MRRRLLGLLAMLASVGCARDVGRQLVRGGLNPSGDQVVLELDSFVQKIPNTTLTLDMVRVPMAVAHAEAPAHAEVPAHAEAPAHAEVPARVDPAAPRAPAQPTSRSLWFSSHEVSWEAFDTFVFGLDEREPGTLAGAEPGVDAVVRPSNPHVLADYGFGRAGFPVISVSPRGAMAFCDWLSLRTGQPYRLPTEVEWEAAARAAGFATSGAELRASGQKYAWLADNAQRRTHPIGRRRTDAAGLHDIFGNAAEWCLDADGEPVLKGGSFQTPASELGPSWRALPTPAWNQRDPQIPQSRWWLSDAPFAGFRVVCDDPLARPDTTPADASPPTEDDR